MTNLFVLLTCCLIKTNQFPVGANDSFGSWAQNYCWTACISYVATSGVYVVQYRNTANPQIFTEGGIWGMEWTTLNTLSNIDVKQPDGSLTSFPPCGFFTNYIPYSTNTITFPIAPEPVNIYFRMQRIGDI